MRLLMSRARVSSFQDKNQMRNKLWVLRQISKPLGGKHDKADHNSGYSD